MLVPTEYGSYIVLWDDWLPCTFIGEFIVSLPLPDEFVYSYDVEDDLHTAEDFVQDLLNGTGEWMNQYNTSITLVDSVPLLITHSDYPEGPAN